MSQAGDRSTLMNAPTSHPVVSADEWLAQRHALLAREKALTRLHDEVAAQRRVLPRTRVDKRYTLDTLQGPRALADLFDGRSQLLVQHFMFGPGWEQGCPSCSFMADHMGGMELHLQHRDVSVLAVSRAPLAEIERFRQRMGWQFRWASSHGSDFNHDFAVSFTPEQRARGNGEVFYNYGMQPFPADEAPGISVFVRSDAGEVFHAYSTFGRGVEAMMGTYQLLDLTPQGRHETNPAYPMDWVRHHDRRHSLHRPTRRRAGAAPHGAEPHTVETATMDATLWSWLAIAAMGALHGLNPLTGWGLTTTWSLCYRYRHPRCWR
eukprot:gene157-158_t